MRTCRICGIIIPFGNSSMNVKRQYRAGRICKVCYKYEGRIKANRLYLNGNQRAKMCKEPDKKDCVICGKSFWTAYSKSVCCSKECKCIRQKEIEKQWRIKNEYRFLSKVDNRSV